MIKYVNCFLEDDPSNSWKAKVEIVHPGNPTESNVFSKGTHFHLLVGRHQYGNYLCVPNLSVCSELAALDDRFWNAEQLRCCSNLNEIDSETLAQVIYSPAPYIGS